MGFRRFDGACGHFSCGPGFLHAGWVSQSFRPHRRLDRRPALRYCASALLSADRPRGSSGIAQRSGLRRAFNGDRQHLGGAIAGEFRQYAQGWEPVPWAGYLPGTPLPRGGLRHRGRNGVLSLHGPAVLERRLCPALLQTAAFREFLHFDEHQRRAVTGTRILMLATHLLERPIPLLGSSEPVILLPFRPEQGTKRIVLPQADADSE